MGTLRFSFLAVTLFVLAFIGISWANKGFPVMAMRVAPLKPDARIPTFEDSVKQGLRKDWEASKTNQSDGDKERHKLRIALLQASIGYRLSPCDPTMKKNLVEALTNYTSAWATMAGCKYGVCTGDDKKLDAATAAFRTPADMHARQELGKAFEQGGISRDDFPSAIRRQVLMFSGIPFAPPESACMAGRKSESWTR